ncbi:hypothetical protein [Dyella nitratireducens]|nr:hypothetical protein [Dyella nitratireducens]
MSTVVSAASITPVVNLDPKLCGDLLGVIKEGRIVNLSNDQLCNLKLATLSAAAAHGFSFPQWSPLSVPDASDMYVKMISANRAPRSVAREPDYANAKRIAQQASAENNLSFYTASVPVEGEWTTKNSSLTPTHANVRDLTFVSMELRRCSRLRDTISSPYYASFEGPDMKVAIPTNSDTSGAELTLWKGKPYLIGITYKWEPEGPSHSAIVVMLNNLWFSSGSERFDAALSGATKCMYRIEK